MQPTGPYADDLKLAMRIADAVDAFTLKSFNGEDLTVELKEDDTPVTAVDREAERMVRRYLDDERRTDAVYGEEYGSKGGSARQWIIDPVDGTKNYIRDISVWATLIALVDERKPVVGVVSAPALGMRWFAAKGDGAWKGRSLRSCGSHPRFHARKPVRRHALVFLVVRLGGARHAARLPRTHPPRVAYQGFW